MASKVKLVRGTISAVSHTMDLTSEISDEEEYFKEEDSILDYDIVRDPEQIELVNKLEQSANKIDSKGEPKRPVLANFSGTGQGKTVVAILLAQRLNRKIIIYNPARASLTWIHHLEKMCYLDQLVYITSLSTVAEGKCYDIESLVRTKSGSVTINCPHYYPKGHSTKDKTYIWDDEKCEETFKNSLIVIDEAHMITTKSQRSLFMLNLFDYLKYNDGSGSRLKKWNVRILIQTATIAEHLERYTRILYLMGIIGDETPLSFRKFIEQALKECHEKELDRDVDEVTAIKRYLKNPDFPYAVAMPRPRYPFVNNIQVQLFSMSEQVTTQIEETNQKIAKMVKESNGNKRGMDKLQSMRKQVEAQMIPLYVAITKAMLAKGYHVTVFMCFLETIDVLKDELKDYNPVVITGKLSNKAVRDKHQTDFREGRCKLLILSVGVGSTSISLHDTKGVIKKTVKNKGNLELKITGAHAALLSIVFSVIDFVQMIGRLYRMGLKSDVYQLLPLVKCASHYTIAHNIRHKLTILESFNDDVSHSENLYEAIEGNAKDVQYDDIMDRDDVSEMVNSIIPDITTDTFRLKSQEEVQEIQLRLKDRSTSIKPVVSKKEYPNKTECSNSSIQVIFSDGLYHFTNVYHIRDILKSSGGYWHSSTKVWSLHPSKIKILTEKLPSEYKMEFMETSRFISESPSPRKLLISETPKNYNQTTVVKICKKGGQVVQGCDVYIGRGMNYGAWKGLVKSKWHNPYKVGNEYSLEESLSLYENRIRSTPVLYNSLHELKGKILGCWCSDDNGPTIIMNPRCHGHILVKLIQESEL